MFYLLFLVIFSNFLTIPVVREKIKVKLSLAIPIGVSTTLVNEIIDTPSLTALQTIKILFIESKSVTHLFNFLLHDFL